MNQDRADAPKREVAAGNGKRSPGRGPRKEHKRHWLFLLVDILLLAAIVGAIIFIVSLLSPHSLFDGADREERAITYQIELPGVKLENFVLNEGDTLVDSETGSVIGTVVSFSGRDYEVYTGTAGDHDGEYDRVMAEKYTYPSDQYQTVTVTVSVNADYQVGVGYSVGDCRIAVGREYQIRFPHYTDDGVCVGITAE